MSLLFTLPTFRGRRDALFGCSERKGPGPWGSLLLVALENFKRSHGDSNEYA